MRKPRERPRIRASESRLGGGLEPSTRNWKRLERSSRPSGEQPRSGITRSASEEEGKIDRAAWDRSAANAVAGGGLGYVPVAGGGLSAASGAVIEAVAKDYEDGVKEDTEGRRQDVSETRSGQMKALVETWQRHNGNRAEAQPSGFDYDDLHGRITGHANHAGDETKQAVGNK